MGYDGDLENLHDDCVPTDDVVSYVCANHWDEMEAVIESARAQKWVLQSKPCLELLSAVSELDRAYTQGALKNRLQKNQNEKDDVNEEQLLAIATNASRVLEQVAESIPGYRSVSSHDDSIERALEPTTTRSLLGSAETCSVGDDLSWAQDLLMIARAFRDLLSVFSDAETQGSPSRMHLRQPIEVINSYLCQSPGQLVVYWERRGDRQVRFNRCPDPEYPNLSSFIANWISDYLKNYYPLVDLGVCAECGRFFERERRDKTFCSKTCQNRVAYKRKKIFESDAFAPVNVAPDDACEIEAGLWLHHPRYGIGLIEFVGNETTPMRALLSDSPPSGERRIRYRSMLSRRINVKVRFLHGIRVLGYSDIFEGQKREDQLPTFYRVKSEETLVRLL